jgi:nicotinamidase-related amidase
MSTKTALIIVDVQNDFLPPDGALAVPGGREIIVPLKQLLSDAWNWKAVIATQVSNPVFLTRRCTAQRVGLSSEGPYLIRIDPRRLQTA